MSRAPLVSVVLLALGCSSGPVSVGDDRSGAAGAAGAGTSGAASGGAPNGGGSSGGSAGAFAGDGGAPSGPPTAVQLADLLEPCAMISDGLLAREAGKTRDVPVCALNSAVYWTSQLSVDCDGKRTDTCNSTTDPQSSSNTLGKDSNGDSLDAAVVPFVEVPRASVTFDYEAAGLHMGSVVAVIYKDKVAYGVLGQEQAQDVIGAASVKMAELLGINPDPIRGGLQVKEVSYFAFKGPEYVVPALEDVVAAAKLGESAAAELVAQGR